MSRPPLDFGDRVRVRVTAVTEAAGLAGLAGQVFGFTTPSVTAIVPIGDAAADRAYSVSIEARGAEFWLTPDLLEFVDHGAGTKIKIGLHGQEMVRTAAGTWEPVTSEGAPETAGPAQTRPAPEPAAAKKKPWWKFWG